MTEVSEEKSSKFQRENNYNLEDYPANYQSSVKTESRYYQTFNIENIYSQASFLRKLLKDASQQTGN